MGILKLLLSILGIGMVLGEPTDNCEENTEEKSTNNGSGSVESSSNFGQAEQEEGDRLSEQVSDTINVENEPNNEAGASRVSSDKFFYGEWRPHEFTDFVGQTPNIQILPVMNEESTHSTSLRNGSDKIRLFKTRHYVHCYGLFSRAFCLMNGYISTTPALGNLMQNLVGSDPERGGLCFFVLKVSLMFNFSVLHWGNEHAKAVLVDQRVLTNPDIINDLLEGVLSKLSCGVDMQWMIKCGYSMLHDEKYMQKFAGPLEHYIPKVYRDVLSMLCKLFEYQVTTGHDENSDMVDQMLLGCILMLGGMYFKMYTNSIKGNNTFRDRIGDPNTAARCGDIGKKCYEMQKMLLRVYKCRSDRGYECGDIVIPRELAARLSRDVFMIIENHYPDGGVPYSVFVRDIVKSVTKLINKYGIDLFNSDIDLYEQRYCSGSLNMRPRNRSSSGSGFVVFNESVNPQSNLVVSIILPDSGSRVIQEPIQSDKESDTMSEALSRVQISEEDTVEHGEGAGGVDYSKLGARPKDKCASESSERSTLKRQSVPVSTDDTEGSICAEEVEEHIGHRPAAVELMVTQKVANFQREHSGYLYSMLKLMFINLDGKLCLTYRCRDLVCEASDGDPEMEKLCEDVLKIFMLCQFYFLHCGKSDCSEFYVHNRNCFSDVKKYVDGVLCNIVDIVKSKTDLDVVRNCIVVKLVQNSYQLDMARTPHCPRFYRNVMHLLCKLREYLEDHRCQSRRFSKGCVKQLMFGCSVIMGSMYGDMDGQVSQDQINNPLSYKLYCTMRMCMCMYNDSDKETGVRCVSNVPNVLLALCSRGLLRLIEGKYSNGKVPFWLCVYDIVRNVCDLMTGDNITLMFDDIRKYEDIYNQDRQSEDCSRGGDGSNDNFPYKPASNSGRGL